MRALLEARGAAILRWGRASHVFFGNVLILSNLPTWGLIREKLRQLLSSFSCQFRKPAQRRQRPPHASGYRKPLLNLGMVGPENSEYSRLHLTVCEGLFGKRT